MIQRPKYNEIGLTEADNKVLISELTKYAEEGASDEELKAFRDTFISEKKKSTPKSGTQPQSTSTTKAEKSVSAPTSGSSGLLETQKFGKDLIVESNKQVAEKQIKKTPQAKETSFQEQVKQPDVFEGEYKDFSTRETKKTTPTISQSKNQQIANEAYDYALKNVDIKKSEERLADELNAYQLTDGIKDGLKGVFNTVVANPLNAINSALGGDKDFRIKEYKPLEDELKVARRELEQEYGPKAQITQSQIQKKAEELFIKKDQQEQMQQLIDRALPSGYDREGIWKELKLDQLRSNDKLRSAVASVEVFNSQIKEFDSFAKSISNRPPTPQEIEKFNSLKERAVTAVEGLDFIGNNFENYLKDAKTDAEKLELFKYNYNDFEKNPTLLWNTAKNIVAGTTKLLAETSIYANRARGDYNNPIAQSLSEMSSEELNQNEAESSQFYRYKASNINSWSDLGSLTTQLASEQIPVLASIYMGGNSGTGIVSLSSGGQKINELEEQAKQPFGKIYSQGEKLLAGYLYAGAEFFPEKFGTARILKDLERTVSSASSASRKLFTDGFMQSTFSGIKNTTKNVFLEGGTEYITAEGQIAIDKDLLGIVESDYKKNQKRSESFFAGALMGAGMSMVGGAVGFGVSQSKLYSDRKDIKRVKEILANVDVINSEIENNKTLTDAEKKELYSKMNEMNNEAFTIVEKNAMNGVNLSVREKSFLLDVNQKQNELISKAEEVKNSNFSKEIKQGMLNDLKTQFESLEQNRMKTLEGKYEPSMESKPSTKTEETDAETKSTTPESEVKSEAEVQKPTEVEEEVNNKVLELEKQRDAEIEDLKSKRQYDKKYIDPIREKYDALILKEKVKETESKIKRKDLFSDGGTFSNVLGGSRVDSVPTNHSEINGIEFVQFSNPNTGIVDVIMSGTSDSDFVGYYRIYENGKPTDKWSSKFENQSRNKENFKTMIGGVQSMLPKGHQYTEKTSISTDGLRIWEQQLNRGYETQTDSEGNILTDEVAINGDAIVNELGIDVEQGQFNNISVTNAEQFAKVKKALIPYLTKLGLTEKNIRWENGTVKIDLPVLKQKTDETQAQGNTPTDGNIRPTTEQVGEMATEQSPKTEVAETKVVESAVEPKPSEGVTTEYLADMVPVIRFNPSGENEILTGEDAISAENEIEEIVSSAISPKQAIAEANKRGLIFRNGAEKESFRQFVADRIEGRTNESFANWRKDTNKKQVETKPTRKEIRKKAVEVKIDEIANSVKNLESVFGIKIKAQGDDINAQGTSREQLIDFIAKTAKEIAKTGIEIDEAIRTVIDEIKKSFDTDIEVDEVRGLVEEKPEPKRTFEREQGKKSLLSRMSEGENSKSVQEAIEKYELNYEVENQEVAKKNAEAFVKEVGFDKAFTAIKENKITGAEKAFVYNRLLEIVNDKMESEGLQASEETISEYKELYGFITNEFDKESREAGRFISALNNVYNSSMLMYNLSNQIERHKAMGDGTIDEETLAMFKEADENIKRLEKQIKEAEKRANEAEEQLAIRNIEEDIARKKKGAPKTKSQQAKEIANKIRKAKIHKPGIFSSATPGSLAWDGAVEVIAKTIESGGTVADAINKGIEYIRKSKWYQSLADEQKSEAERELRGYIRETTKQPFVSISEDGKIKIPEKIIRDYVEQGVTDINDLSKKILDDIKEEYPKVTERQVRDAITRYGKTVNPSQDEIDAQIRKMKRIGKLVSGLEDAYSGKRPLRSGLQRDILTPEERKMQRELKELLRDIPMDESDLQKTWKTALDAIKTRLNNQITDLENQIANREKRKPEKTPIEYDQEAKDLRAKVESLKEALDEIVGKPELTEEQKIQKAVAGLEKSIESLTEQITNKQLEFKKKPSPIVSDEITRLREQQKALRNEILQMRKDAGIVEKRRLELAKLRTQNQITDLQRRIAEKDYTKKEISKIIPDDELTKLKAEKLKWQEVYDKDKYKQELKNRTINQRVIDGLFGVWNLPRVVMATGEMSWILIQGGVQSMSILTRNPAQFVENLRRMVVAMGSADKANELERKVKATEIYQIAKDSKLALTEVDHQLDVREEQFLGDYASAIWDLNGLIAEQFLGKKERPLIGDKIKQLFVGKKEYAKTASAREQIKNVNPLRVLERGNTSYMNQLRLNRFIEGVEKLKLEGKDPVKDIEDYKALAKAINTLTGRANVPQFLKTTDPKVLAAIFFSFRNWVSKLNMLNPVFYYSLGNYSKPSEIFTKKPTVAQKIAITDMMRYITITTSMMYLIQAAAGKDDEGEDVISIETDPRSSDYMKMRMGDLRLDPWGGLQSTITFFMRMATDQTKSTKTGEILTGGERFGARTRGELFQDYVSGKFNPSAGLIWEYMHTKQKTDENGETYRENKFGEKFSIAEDVYNIKPMYWEAISEIKKEQPGVWGNFIIAAGALGINTQVYGKPKEGETSGPPKLPSMPSLPKLPKMP